MSITTSQKSASYKTIGLESDVTFEAQSAGMGFEDVMSTAGARLLQQAMIMEEHAILGGNLSVANPAQIDACLEGMGAARIAEVVGDLGRASEVEGCLAVAATYIDNTGRDGNAGFNIRGLDGLDPISHGVFWSLFVNVLGLPLICAMFVAEYIYRVLRYRHFSHAPLIASVWAFQKFGRGSVSPGRGS
jgi:hypothetical protein